MSVKELKEQIKQQLEAVEDEQLLQLIDQLLAKRLVKPYTLSNEEKQAIEEGLAEYRAGKFNTEEEDKTFFEKWFKDEEK